MFPNLILHISYKVQTKKKLAKIKRETRYAVWRERSTAIGGGGMPVPMPATLSRFSPAGLSICLPRFRQRRDARPQRRRQGWPCGNHRL